MSPKGSANSLKESAMAPPERPRKRSYPCNSDLMTFLRERKGWTQYELAVASGYSERLINKAESGRPISTGAIEILAETLSLPEEPISLEDLICDPVALAKEYMAALYTQQGNIVSAIRHFLDDDVVFWVAGDPAIFPFAGEHRGIPQIDAAFQRFFAVLQAPENHDHEPGFSYLAQGRDVIVWGESWLHPIGTPMEKPVMITHRLTFHKGKLVRFEDIFDTLQGARVLQDARLSEPETDVNVAKQI